ncbi:hypothetical protein FD13_GL001869 [Levilactobacillus senmaizukei DSM 21775 = NBRC 103853]|uniref:Uncharacterized protein n=1 Tax=Levilactobacillus senmaizukei DSM 21775 = NBRC 103853 TaxID=1423803 RepID=A0A0R2DEG9_9LACO|nr:hypothetical protein [Levilactobacillus senmaizukei]KRN02416.1 hypothetical protein FD13_GL001869 [Levilactobacillus senmaizukei DSM 21775 = NBRC 103853]
MTQLANEVTTINRLDIVFAWVGSLWVVFAVFNLLSNNLYDINSGGSTLLTLLLLIMAILLSLALSGHYFLALRHSFKQTPVKPGKTTPKN